MDAEVSFGKPEFYSGSRNFIREAEVLFGMTEFRLRQYSPIQSNPIAGIGITPFGRDRWFRHPVSIPVAGNGVPIWDEVVLFWKPKFHSGSRSFIWDDGVPTPSILVIEI